MTRYTCCDNLRRNAVFDHPVLNGIDFLEVLDRDAPPLSPRQRTLLVHCLKVVPLLAPEQVTITGGERVRNIRVEWVAIANAAPVALTTAAERAFFTALPDADHVLVVRTSDFGDYSPYLLRLQRSDIDTRPPLTFDTRLSELTFSFKIECGSDFDCRPVHQCDTPSSTAPLINYLAKDYASFRSVILDRLGQLIPNWRDRSPADLAVTLAELLAYTGDHLSYWQDAVATEAYLGSARKRVSLRRHALLVDYAIDEGNNARVWLQLQLAGGVPNATVALAGMSFFSRLPKLPAQIDPLSPEYQTALNLRPVIFEPMDPAGALEPMAASQVTLDASHHEMQFYAWGDQRCCLPAGSTRATLLGHRDTLTVGQVLIFEEVLGPNTGEPEDADPTHRHAIRLTSVQFDEDGAPLIDGLNNLQITEIAWAADDALPFPLCISAQTAKGFRSAISVARGNIILADHGRTVANEPLGAVPAIRLRYPLAGGDRCATGPAKPVEPRYRPMLAERPLTQAATVPQQGSQTEPMRFDPAAPAASAFSFKRDDIWPSIRLNGGSWLSRRDLLNSGDEDPHFVVECEHDGSAFLRFGDDHNGKRPDSGFAFAAAYRVGNGLSGAVGADTIAHVVTGDVRVAAVRNPLASKGARDPESAAQVRRRAPQAFRTQMRAVTPQDYADVTQRFPGVQRAAATMRWTGSWYTVFITVDRLGGQPMDPAFKKALATFVEPFRMAGHDLELNNPVYVSLEIDITVCVARDYFRSAVRAALLNVLSDRDLGNGLQGLFHPDRLTFGQTVFLSPIYAAARSVPGVESLEITTFQRQGQPETRFLQEGEMRLSRLEIPRLSNDLSFPEHGVLNLSIHGGK